MAKKKLLLIAGHGEGDPGACSIWGQEADYTRELATLVKQSVGNRMLVTMYDQNKNCYEQSRRGNVPVYTDYDMTLEVHFNAKAKKDPYGDGSFTGVGGYIHPNNEGRAVARSIIDKVVGLGFKEWLLADSTGLLNLNNAQRQEAKYFLLETAFIDDGDDMNFYCEHKGAFATAIAQGIMDGLGMSSTAAEVAEKEYWRVRTSWEDTKSQLYAMETREAATRVCPAGYSVYDPSGKCVYTKETSGTQVSAWGNCTEEEYIEKVGPFYTKDEQKNGILACVSLAQNLLECGYGKTDLAQKGNNVHGMKCSLSGNVWAGTTWDGSSLIEKDSPEVIDGVTVMKRSQFRSYGCLEDSIEDHAAYLLNAANGKKRRYEGLQGEKDYRKAIHIIKSGGYATDPLYEDKVCSLIERWGLERFNAPAGSESVSKPETEPAEKPEKSGVPYLIHTTCDWLWIRSTPGMEGNIVGSIQEEDGEKKDYTIVEESNGWGRLKSGIGWICLDYTEKV